MSLWFNKDGKTVLSELGSDTATGLTAEEIKQRLAAHGPNELTEQGGRGLWRILLEQFSSLMVILLIVAALVSGLVLGEKEDAIVILVVVILNAILGFRQEFKAERAMAALKKLSIPMVRVRRDGETTQVPASELVPGDIIELEAGNLVPADCRLLETANLRIQESALTGEAEAVEKNTAALEQTNLVIGDRKNMAYMGTIVTYGRGMGVVTATGMSTELGNIATLIQNAEDEKTVLQKKLHQLSRVLVFTALALITVVALEAWLIRHMALKEIFMTSVSMAVAAIPEGLPAVVTIALALGAQRMLKRQALIRKLPAVETLGSVTTICSDKTGTLTQNRMSVATICLPDNVIDLPDTPALRAEKLSGQLLETHPDITFLLAAGALCNDAVIRTGDNGEVTNVIGDPTEGALVELAIRAGWSKDTLEAALPRVSEIPFDSERKEMTTVHRFKPGTNTDIPALATIAAYINGADIAFTKGAVDVILSEAESIMIEGKTVPLTREWRQGISQTNERMAGDGIRVLGLAMRKVAGREEELENHLVYLGMVGILDPLRAEVREAVKTCHLAGIRPIMITGDHPLIALNIGRSLGLAQNEQYHTGSELATMTQTELEKEVQNVSVYARVAPEHKLRIVDALQKDGQIVAMTGDGVNDAPALKEADIGVAMGITGTDVSKEAADMILQDDNFATIVAAVQEGRIILDNIIRFVRFILASNWAEILAMLLSPLFGLPLPLYPVQILWMNLVTDGLPALALGVEPGESDVMKRAPRHPKAPIISRATGVHILIVGLLMALVALVVGRMFYDGTASIGGVHAASHGYGDAAVWQTMLFTVLVCSQLALALAERSTHDPLYRIGLFSNPHMLGAIAITVGLQMAVIYAPPLQQFFHTAPLDAMHLLICIAASLLIFALVELKKLIFNRRGAI